MNILCRTRGQSYNDVVNKLVAQLNEMEREDLNEKLQLKQTLKELKSKIKGKEF